MWNHGDMLKIGKFEGFYYFIFFCVHELWKKL